MPSMPQRAPDPRNGIRAFLVLDGAVRLLLWVASMSGALAVMGAFGKWPEHSLRTTTFGEAWHWADRLMWAILLFNFFYVTGLILLRLPIPTPKDGVYAMRPGRMPDRNLIWSALIATLTKARFFPPFPGFLVHHVASLPPLCWFMSAIFGPKSRSCGVTDPMVIDPYGVEIGRNVVIGYGAIITAHAQGRDEVTLMRTVIEDNVLIGGNAVIYHGCRIRNGAVIMGGALVRPNTVVGENEVWGGIPAKHIKTLPPYDANERDAASVV